LNSESPKQPEHVCVYLRLREMILCGDLAPGQAVTIQGLAGLLEAGMTPVREGIRRLISEGALQFQGNRRVSVPVLGESQIDEILFARLALEPELVRRATKFIHTVQLEDLRGIDDRLNQAIARGDVTDYMAQNHRFHMTLYALAGSDIVLPMVEALWLRAAPSLRVMCGRFGTRNLPDMHQEALAALAVRNGAAAARSIEEDIRQGMENVRAVLKGR
jgi:DNA-binding GntR family transcriptional regulator